MNNPSANATGNGLTTVTNMELPEFEVRKCSCCVALQPSDQPRGPPRAIYELGISPGTSHAHVIEIMASRHHLGNIFLYFISAADLKNPPDNYHLPNPDGINWAPPALNKYLPPRDTKVRRWDAHHILLPELPPFVTRENSMVSIKIGPGGIPEQYESDGPYVLTRSQNDTVFDFLPPENGTTTVAFNLELLHRHTIEVPLPPAVPELRAGEPARDEVMDTVRIDIEQQGFANYLSLHIRVIDAKTPEMKAAGIVQPRLFNISSVRSPEENPQGALVPDGNSTYHPIHIKLIPLKTMSFKMLYKYPRTWPPGF
ncbi:hypothetical protein B0T10DRAFT_473508 [Thelonectria olida]|uniref:Uncharacterized protein n=1 Tax=Thelonectria olida TaxID=1576542 RepID=A0A9P9AVY7_9HYPO|nr:hypothetical protein B0T10DRAFT_473508 [Thelonectria olida]